MIVVELITNSANHAFRQAPGTIKVEIRCVEGAVRCHVKDDGSSRGLPVQPGTGLSIVTALARELAGTFDQTLHSSGSVSTLTFPLQFDASRADRLDECASVHAVPQGAISRTVGK